MPRRVAIDTGPLVALLDVREQYHARCVDFLRRYRGELLTNLAVMAEAMYLLDFSLDGQIALLRMVQAGAVTLVEPSVEDLNRSAELMVKYADCPMDFADSLLVSACERLGIDQVATLDSDFRIYRLFDRKQFRLLLL